MEKNTIIKEGIDLYKNNFIDGFLSEDVSFENDKNDILNERDKKLLEISCKDILIDSINDNDFKISSIKKINKLNYEQSIKYYLSLNEGKIIQLDEAGIRDFESKTKKFLKYGFAAIVGGKIAGKKGLGVAIIANYLYRKYTDPCWKQCVKTKGFVYNKSCQYQCKSIACKKITNDLRQQLSKCPSTPNPESCEKKLRKNFNTWNKKQQEYMIKYRKHEIKDREREKTKGK